MEISILISILTGRTQKKLNSLAQSIILGNFQNQEHQFTIPKSRKRLTENQEEEQMQL